MSGGERAGEPADPRTTEAIEQTAVEAKVQRFTLRVVDGPDKGASLSSTSDRVVVGSEPPADLVLRDSTVSRFHFEVLVGAAGAELRDLGSLNGTRLDGVRVVHGFLASGSTVAVGRTTLRFEAGEETVPLPVSARGRFGLAVGRAVPMARAFALLERAAASDATVLLEGETGTGKELAGESIHREGARRDGPFVIVDCAALPRDLLEAELFGHTRGAFTGAVRAREGAFEAAAGGTLFLDEIGELPLDLQPKLLRALERREVKRVGSNEYASVDVRIVAATNRNLRGWVNEQRFRSDLFYRLAVIEVRLPPLRERLEDLPLLVENILRQLGALTHPMTGTVRSPEFLRELSEHSWPGNVRELRNYVERCITLAERAPLVPEGESQAPVDTRVALRKARDLCVASFERRYLTAILAEHAGNVTAAARASGIDRVAMYRLLWRHGLR